MGRKYILENEKMNTIKIRTAAEEDAPELLAIYAPYVENTAITYEYEVPTLDEFRNRIHLTLEKYPYLVAEREGVLIGYAYAGVFKARAAYSWCVEASIYVRQDQRRTGTGKLLYEALERILAIQNIRNVYACIACPETEDEYLTKNSIQFHGHLGYRMVGEFKKCAYKFGRWYGMVWMEKQIGDRQGTPEPVRWFGEVRGELDF